MFVEKLQYDAVVVLGLLEECKMPGVRNSLDSRIGYQLGSLLHCHGGALVVLCGDEQNGNVGRNDWRNIGTNRCQFAEPADVEPSVQLGHGLKEICALRMPFT